MSYLWTSMWPSALSAFFLFSLSLRSGELMPPKAELQYFHKKFSFRSRKIYLNGHNFWNDRPNGLFPLRPQKKKRHAQLPCSLGPSILSNSISADIQNCSILTLQELSFPHWHKIGEYFSGKDNFWKHNNVKPFVIWQFTNRSVLTYLDICRIMGSSQIPKTFSNILQQTKTLKLRRNL